MSDKYFLIKGNFVSEFSGSYNPNKKYGGHKNYGIDFYRAEVNNIEILGEQWDDYYDLLKSNLRGVKDGETHYYFDTLVNVLIFPSEEYKAKGNIPYKESLHNVNIYNCQLVQSSSSGNGVVGRIEGEIYALIKGKAEKPKETELEIKPIVEPEVDYRKNSIPWYKQKIKEYTSNEGVSTPIAEQDFGFYWFFKITFSLFWLILLIFILLAFITALSGTLSVFLWLIIGWGLIYFLNRRLSIRFPRLFGTGYNLITTLLSYFFLGVIAYSLLNSSFNKSRTTENNHVNEEDIIPITDTIYISHLRYWNDLEKKGYQGLLSIAKRQVALARYAHNKLQHEDLNEISFWKNTYDSLAKVDRHHMNKIIEMFDSIRKANNLSEYKFAEMIVTCIQDIPYFLIHDKSCEEFNSQNPDGRRLHNQSPCLSQVKFGVQSPSEFMADLKGDCDTRALFLYSVLKEFGYDVAILVSPIYGHSVIGLSLPGDGCHIRQDGKKYYLWETTAKDFHMGEMNPDLSNPNYWHLALN